jgi:ABC-2 type transport system permease protein
VSDSALVIRQTRWALLGAIRNPRVIVFSVAFPIVLLVLFNGIFAGGSEETTQFAGGTIRASAYFTAGMAAYAIMMSAFSTIAIALTTQRESGQLKRVRGTPMPAWIFIAAQVLRSIALVVLMVAALLLIGHLAFDVAIDGEALLGVAVYVALGTASLATLGIALTAVTNSADAASTIAPFSSVMLSFISGVFIPVEQLPNWLSDVGRVFPLYHLADGLQRALVEGAGTGITAGNVAVLLAWTAGALAVSAKRFRWEPQSAAH